MARLDEKTCRVGLMSRLDYPSEGYRRYLLELAAQIFHQEDVHYVALVGGLISARYVKDKQKKLAGKIRLLSKEVKELGKRLGAYKVRRASGDETITETDAAEARKTANRVRQCESKIRRFQSYLKELEPDAMARQLAEQMPAFTDAQGNKVKIHIFPSPAFDGELGAQVAELLAEKYRPEDVNCYPPGGDRLDCEQAGKKLEALVPLKAAWMRGDYFSTPNERVFKDRLRQSASEPADIYVIGCFGSTITKQKGEWPRPIVTVPVLHRVEEVRVNENQIGVRVAHVTADSPEPKMRDYSFKDFVQRERQSISWPGHIPEASQTLFRVLRDKGKMSLGKLAREAGMSRDQAWQGLIKYINKNGKRPKSWPGIRLFEESNRVDFDGYWVRENLPIPKTPGSGEAKVDSIVAFSCLHAGSDRVDYQMFLEDLPKAILESGADILVNAGDSIEGCKYKDENYAGFNYSDQEKIAARLQAKVLYDVFRVRFGELVKGIKKADAASADALDLIARSLPLLVYIAGNHDDFQKRDGHTPLELARGEMIAMLMDLISRELADKGITVPAHLLMEAIGGKLYQPPREDRGEYTLPSGIKMTVMHPCMGRMKTISGRPQQMLEKAFRSQLVIGGNFHVGTQVAAWDGKLGQRVVVQLGTLKMDSDFEDNKLKTVDRGFSCIKLGSVDGRITHTEFAFRTGDSKRRSKLVRGKLLDDFMSMFGLKPDGGKK
jgi:hypothetical protein